MLKKHDLYKEDFYTWCFAQDEILAEKKFDDLDLENLREEIRSLGERHYRELKSRLTNLFLHLLKWKYQPDMRSHSWVYSIKNERREIPKHLKSNPGLKRELEKAVQEGYEDAKWRASLEAPTIIYEDIPVDLTFSLEQALDEKWMPE